MRKSLAVIAAALSLGAASAAYAALPCDDTVVDRVHVISDPGKVAAAAKKLSGVGADVRVWTVSSFKEMGVSNLDQYMEKVLDQCSSWRANASNPKSALKSTMVVVMIHPSAYLDPGTYKRPSVLDTGIYYGVQNASKLKAAWSSIEDSTLKPSITAYNNGEKDAYTRGFVNMMDSLGVTLKPPMPVTSTGPTTIINQAPADYSGFGSALIWIVIIGAAGVVLAFFFYSRQGASADQGFQAKAHRARSNCLNRIIELTDTVKRDEFTSMMTAFNARLSAADAGALDSAFADYKRKGDAAAAAFNRFDAVDKDDPNKNGLSAEVYRSNEQSYQDILVQFIEPAETSLQQVKDLLEKAHLARNAA